MLRPPAAASIARKRSIAPLLEPLENRRLLAKAVAQVTVQEIPVSTGSTNDNLIVMGTSKNDSILITDNGKQQAGSLMVTANGTVHYTTQHPISSIVVLTGSGKDKLDYELQGDLQPDVFEYLFASSSGKGSFVTKPIKGGGNLQVTVNVIGKVMKDSTLFAFVGPDSKGATTLDVNNSGDIDGSLAVEIPTVTALSSKKLGPTNFSLSSTAKLGTSGSLIAGVNGGKSQNSANIMYSGTNNGDITFFANGSGAKDVLAADVEMTAGSTGTVGKTSTSIVGGFGKSPRVRFFIARGTDESSKTGINATIQTTSKRSVSAHTPNVTGVTAGSDSAVS